MRIDAATMAAVAAMAGVYLVSQRRTPESAAVTPGARAYPPWGFLSPAPAPLTPPRPDASPDIDTDPLIGPTFGAAPTTLGAPEPTDVIRPLLTPLPPYVYDRHNYKLIRCTPENRSLCRDMLDRGHLAANPF